MNTSRLLLITLSTLCLHAYANTVTDVVATSRIKHDSALKTDFSVTTFSAWHAAIAALPKGVENGAITRQRSTNYSGVQTAQGLTQEVFEQALNEYCTLAKKGPLSNPQAWLKGIAPASTFYNLANATKRAIYVQRVKVPESTPIVLHGDLHGDVHGLVETMADYVDDNFKLKDPKAYVTFLGDYVDRGLYGYECIYTLLRLSNANPGKVFLARGNHEDRDVCCRHGFSKELAAKNISSALIEKIFNWYELLPAAIFIECNNNALQCCHGGIEPDYKPNKLLNAPACVHYQRLASLKPLNGFMWSDFQVDSQRSTQPSSGRRECYGRAGTYKYLAAASTGAVKLRGIMRAHQHTGPMMDRILGTDGMNIDNHGAAKLWTTLQQTGNKLWPGIVVTFNVSPDSAYGIDAFTYDTHGILTVAANFKDWTLQIKRKEIMATGSHTAS